MEWHEELRGDDGSTERKCWEEHKFHIFSFAGRGLSLARKYVGRFVVADFGSFTSNYG